MIDLDNLLLEPAETEWLDFKQVYQDNTVTLVHDILCLSNSYADRNRLLVYGVANDRSIHDITSDPNRKSNADLKDLLRQSNFNRIPVVHLHQISFRMAMVDVLEISNRPVKPYFLTKDKTHGKETLRAGVIYTRIGDTNIPFKESAPDDHIEVMWRERFGIGVPPLTRITSLLDDIVNWENLNTVDGPTFKYHKVFPEFTIVDIEFDDRSWIEEWSAKLPDSHIFKYLVQLKFHNTLLNEVFLAGCDGGRYMLPFPKKQEDGNWQVDASSREFKVACLYEPLDGMSVQAVLSRCGVRVVNQATLA